MVQLVSINIDLCAPISSLLWSWWYRMKNDFHPLDHQAYEAAVCIYFMQSICVPIQKSCIYKYQHITAPIHRHFSWISKRFRNAFGNENYFVLFLSGFFFVKFINRCRLTPSTLRHANIRFNQLSFSNNDSSIESESNKLKRKQRNITNGSDDKVYKAVILWAPFNPNYVCSQNCVFVSITRHLMLLRSNALLYYLTNIFNSWTLFSFMKHFFFCQTIWIYAHFWYMNPYTYI